jgi:sugar/nucleoside kinase (ribokinase family)
VAAALARLGRKSRLITGLHVDTEVIEGPNGEEYVIPPLPPIPLPDPLVGQAVILSPITQEIIPDQIPPVHGLLVIDLQGFVRVPGKPTAHPGKRFDLRELLRRADLVKASTVELALLTDESRDVLKQTTLVETRGRWGAIVHAGEKTATVDAQYVPVHDTIGAGDTFLAALVDAFTRGKSPVEAATAAARFTEAVLRERLDHEPKSD